MPRGGVLKGEACPWAKLTEADISDIRCKYWGSTRYTQDELAIEHGVSRTTIQKILHNETWKHVGR